jgi:hypothetical protein
MEQKRFDVPYSDEWWFKRLFDRFFESNERRDGVNRNRHQWLEYLWSWYEGNPPLSQYQEGWQAQVTRQVLREARANFAMLAVESKLDRLKLQSFRTVDPADDEKSEAEKSARRLMSKYVTVFQDALLHASVMGEGYIWVSGEKGRDGLPTVTAEDPRSCIAITDPIDANEVVAAMKIYYDPLTGFEYAHLALPADDDYPADPDARPARIRIAKRKSNSLGVAPRFYSRQWDWDDEASGELPIQDRGVFVHKVTGPSAYADIEPFLDLLQRINATIVDRLWISKFQAFRQRALVDKSKDADDDFEGDDDDDDAETDSNGDPIDWDYLLSADPGALWRLPRGMEMWESTPVDLQNILLAVRDDVKEFAAVSRTPLYVFAPEAVEGSAEGASLARESQVFKVERWQERVQRPFLSACADMLVAAGHSDPGEIELQWLPADRVTMAQRGQAATAAKATGVPEEGIWEQFWQMDPETIKRWKKMRRLERLLAPQQQFAPAQRPADAAVPPPGAPPEPDAPVDANGRTS